MFQNRPEFEIDREDVDCKLLASMKSSRRKFLTTSGAMLLTRAVDRAWGDSSLNTSLPDIRATLLSQGFDPSHPDSVLMAVVADVHINLAEGVTQTVALEDDLVAELNGLQPQLTHLAIAGDVISSHSDAVGLPRYPSHYKISRREMELFGAQLGRFRSDLEVLAVPGNHDTDNLDNHAGGEPRLWNEILGLAPYQKRVLGGVPVFFLNSGHAGDLGPAQAAWFAREAATVSKDQDVLIVLHHPVFFYLAGETGAKRKIAKAFAGHRGIIWLIGGHGHSFVEDSFIDQGTRYVQMEVTAGRRNLTSDSNSPGYALLALQGGKLVTRIFRSLKQPGFFPPRSPINQLTFRELRWPFDRVEYPGELYEEGEYDRTGKVLEFSANDVVTHFAYFERMTVKVDLTRFGGKATEFLVCASIANNVLPKVSCLFSASGPSGPWESFSFPPNDGSAVYRIPIPAAMRSLRAIHVKVSSALTQYAGSITFAGWGIGSSAEMLNGFEKWSSRTHRTFLLEGESHPEAAVVATGLKNVIHYGFNLPVPKLGELDSVAENSEGRTLARAASGPISGLPEFSSSIEEVLDFRFARRTRASDPGLSYVVETSRDLLNWEIIEEERVRVTAIEDGWEEVSLQTTKLEGRAAYFRVRVEAIPGSSGSFRRWEQEVAVTSGIPDDRNADGLSDLLQFAFDQREGEGVYRPYDSSRVARKAGMPVTGNRRVRISRLLYPRIRREEDADVSYIVERSTDLKVWIPLKEGSFDDRVIRTDGGWELVEAVVYDDDRKTSYFRVNVQLAGYSKA